MKTFGRTEEAMKFLDGVRLMGKNIEAARAEAARASELGRAQAE